MSREGAWLVRAPNWVGDLVMATPAFRALHAATPGRRRVLWVRRQLAPLLSASPWFDAVVPLDDGGGRGPGRLGTLLREARSLAARHGPFERGFCLPDSFSSALAMRAAGVRELVGYRRAGRGLLLHRAVSPRPEWGPRRWVARERSLLHLLEQAGIPPRGTGLELHVGQEEEAEADRLLDGRGRLGGPPLVLLAPGASFGPSKRWPLASFASLAAGLVREGADVVLTGAPSEAALGADLSGSLGVPVLDLVGRCGLGPFKALARRAALVVCNDAGARHVAVAMGARVLVFLGPTSLAKTDLNLERVRVLERRDVPCRPCYLRECPIDHPCLAGIAPGQALDAARELLAEVPR